MNNIDLSAWLYGSFGLSEIKPCMRERKMQGKGLLKLLNDTSTNWME